MEKDQLEAFSAIYLCTFLVAVIQQLKNLHPKPLFSSLTIFEFYTQYFSNKELISMSLLGFKQGEGDIGLFITLVLKVL